MSRRSQRLKAITRGCQRIGKKFLSAINKQIIWLLRTIFQTHRRRDTANAGFVLPTVVMVSIVVILLTTAILFRSFERAKNASNVRVSETVMNAAMPAIDRARAKLEQLLTDPSLPRSTPTDIALYSVIRDSRRYDFGDEIRLKLASNINGNDKIDNGIDNGVYTLENDETLSTAWKFPVDTDNNGKFDSYTLYAIYFRSPSRNTSNQFTRSRSPLDARTPPMDKSQIGGICADAVGTSASLVGDSNWYKAGGNLAKSFFVYTVTVPIENLGSLDNTKYERKGGKGFSALEYQQDRERIPVNNKAVWFENDLEITPGGGLLLNGSIHTNGNLLGGSLGSLISFRQVSSKNSCFYDQEYAKITVGGNLAPGGVTDTSNRGGKLGIDLFRGYKQDPWTSDQGATLIEIGASTEHISTTETGGRNVAHDDAAYNMRISKMKNEAINLCSSCTAATTVSDLNSAVAGYARYPDGVKTNYQARVSPPNPTPDIDSAKGILAEEIENYLRDRTRRVPFKETNSTNPGIPTATEALGSYANTSVFGNGAGVIEVPAQWREISSTNTGLSLRLNRLQATEPEKQKNDGKENYAGDRVLIGNNLPAYWKNTDGAYVSGQKARQVVGSTTYWDSANTANEVRTRASQIQPQLSLGDTARNGFWEQKAVEDNSANPLSNVGGLRIVTGAGIYVDDDGAAANGTGSFPRSTNSFLPNPTLDTDFVGGNTNPGGNADDSTPQKMPIGPLSDPPDTTDTLPKIVTWADTMPMTSPLPGETKKGDLLMRATVVYHFKDNAGSAQTPIACISSYYDPTNKFTAQNQSSLTSTWKYPSANETTTDGRSNNGIVYAPPTRTISDANKTILLRQARLIFRNGRIVNEPLRKAMQKYVANGDNFTNFTMEDYSAVDSALCSLSILNGATPATSPAVPHGAIREASFLDAREIKAIQTRTDYQDSTKQGDYGLDLEQRQPLEVRVTEIDLGTLATRSIGTTEYLLPLSGIIYATRDDALLDLSYATIKQGASNPNTNPSPEERKASDNEKKLFSQTDFKLDPTRRPNGIRLINGGNLARGGSNSATYNPSEKGLILASNLPVYVTGDFNLHRSSTTGSQIEEFSDTTNSFYNRATFDNNFACRPGRGACPTSASSGDLWRPSTIISDAITLLSQEFKDGFRSDGDYDLNNNAVSIPASNAPADVVNYFAINASRSWTGSYGSPTTRTTLSYTTALNDSTITVNDTKTSYNANGVTPIQRRATFDEYLMETCNRIPATTCDPNNPAHWRVYVKSGPPVTVTARTATDILNDAPFNTGDVVTNKLASGTTAKAPDADYLRYPRRVAFERDSSGSLILRNSSGTEVTTGGLPVPLGIDGLGNIFRYYYGNSTSPSNKSNALWFKTSSSNTAPNGSDNYGADKPLFLMSLPTGTQQPQLVPVLQIFSPEGSPGDNNNLDIRDNNRGSSQIQNNWVQSASASMVYNTGLVAGNSPGRPTEQSAGLQAFVRNLENWTPSSSARIRGSFIQFKRSAYATAPLATILSAKASAGASVSNNISIYDFQYNTYWTNNGSPVGILPYYFPPGRDWGFDVGLLSQLPDLFAQRFTVPPSAPPAEYFREVGRDDEWVKTLLCAKEATSGTYSVFSVPASYRPSTCITTAYP